MGVGLFSQYQRGCMVTEAGIYGVSAKAKAYGCSTQCIYKLRKTPILSRLDRLKAQKHMKAQNL